MIKNNISKQLKKNDLSQAELAAAAKLSTGMISQFASGRSIPTGEELARICSTLSCREESLYAPEILAMIHGAERPERQGGKSGRGKNVRLTGPIADAVDAYGERYGLSRDQAARTLILLGLREEEWMKKIDYEEGGWYGEAERKNDDNPDTDDPADG